MSMWWLLKKGEIWVRVRCREEGGAEAGCGARLGPAEEAEAGVNSEQRVNRSRDAAVMKNGRCDGDDDKKERCRGGEALRRCGRVVCKSQKGAIAEAEVRSALGEV